MKAIVLAAGEGSRLRPFTSDKPKAMVRAANRPILQYSIDALVANGIRDIVIVLGYHREKVQSYFADGRRSGARITYAFQEALTGTARALATAPSLAEPFLVLGGGNVIEPSLIKAVLDAPGSGPAIVVRHNPTPQMYGVVTLDGDRLKQIVEKPLHPRSEWINTGIYRLTPDLHHTASELAVDAGIGLPDVLQYAITAGVEVKAVRSDALWSDAVYPWDLLRVHADLFRAHGTGAPKLDGALAEPPTLLGEDTTIAPGSVLRAGTCIGSNCAIGPNVVLENCIIYDDVEIGAGSILRNTIVGAGARIGPRLTALSGPCDIHLADGWHHLDDFGAVIGEDARIGGAVTMMPGALIGNRARVHHARTLRGQMEDDSVAF